MQRVKSTHRVVYVRLQSTTGAWLVDPELRPRLVADATAQRTNLTDVAGAILAARYGVPYEPGGRKTDPMAAHAVLNMRLPRPLVAKLRRAAERSGRSDMDEVRHALSEHYGLRMPS